MFELNLLEKLSPSENFVDSFCWTSDFCLRRKENESIDESDGEAGRSFGSKAEKRFISMKINPRFRQRDENCENRFLVRTTEKRRKKFERSEIIRTFYPTRSPFDVRETNSISVLSGNRRIRSAWGKIGAESNGKTRFPWRLFEKEKRRSLNRSSIKR